MPHLKSKIQLLAKLYFPETIEIRRHLHAHPELSFQEFKTSEYIVSKLKQYGISFTQGIVETGIVGIIEGTKSTPSSVQGVGLKCIALRADMDALPITEMTQMCYQSQHEGVMHACGHDVHCAALLVAAKILNELKNEFEGSIKLIFQPGEEKLPGGASLMIKEGVLEHPRPQSIFAQHVHPAMEVGKVGFRNGMYMASTDEIYVTVKGKGGHAALPKDYNNPLLIAAAILQKLNEVFMQNQKEGLPPTVLAFGKIIGNGATNVIPDEVKLEGTFRTMNEQWRAEAHLLMKKYAEEIAIRMGGTCEFNIIVGYPFLINDERTTHHARIAAEEYLGKENVEELPLRMTAEDFSFYSQQIPACFYRLGTGNKAKGITSGVHTTTFDIDEQALEIATGLMAWLTVNELNHF